MKKPIKNPKPNQDVMENKGFYNKFESLPVEAQKQAMSFIDFLQKRYEAKFKRHKNKSVIADKKFVGLWKNRDDLKDSSLWIKNLRKKDRKEIAE